LVFYGNFESFIFAILNIHLDTFLCDFLNHYCLYWLLFIAAQKFHTQPWWARRVEEIKFANDLRSPVLRSFLSCHAEPNTHMSVSQI